MGPRLRADAHGEPVRLKGAHEDRAALAHLRAGQRATAEQHPTEPVGDRERIAAGAVAEAELPFEVDGPDRIGRVHGGLRAPGMPRPAHPTGREHEPRALEMERERAARGPGRRRQLLAQQPEQFARAPAWVAAAGDQEGRGRQGGVAVR